MFDPASPLHRSASTRPSPVTAEAWRALAAQIASEVTGPLGAAMERIHILTGTGRIDRKGLRALRNEVEAARQAGIVTQQIARLAGNEISQAPETLQLSPILRGVLAQRVRDVELRGVQVRPSLSPVEVVTDAPLLFALLNTLLDWALANANSPIELRTDIKSWPAHPRLAVHFTHAPRDRQASPDVAVGLDSLVWHLLEHTASAMGLIAARHVNGAQVDVAIEFPLAARAEPADLEAVAAAQDATRIDDFADTGSPEPQASRPPTASAPSSLQQSSLTEPAPPTPAMLKPLVGSHVLVACAERETRMQVREAIKGMGLIVDFVDSMEEAAAFCHDGLPHAMVFDSSLRGRTFDNLHADLLVEAPDLVFIEVLVPGQRASEGADEIPSVPEAAIGSRLPALLAAGLTRSLQR